MERHALTVLMRVRKTESEMVKEKRSSGKE